MRSGVLAPHRARDAAGPLTTTDRLQDCLTAATAAFAVTALLRPDRLSGDDVSEGQTYFARMYAARALPLALALLHCSRHRRHPPELLAVAAAAQFGDALVGLSQRKLPQVVPTVLAGAIYARMVWRPRDAA